MNLAHNLLQICRQRKMSLSTLSKRSGVKQPTLHGWTTGRSVQNLEDLRKVCEVLRVGFHSLIFGRSDPYEGGEKLLEELFKGEVRITISRIEKVRRAGDEER